LAVAAAELEEEVAEAEAKETVAEAEAKETVAAAELEEAIAEPEPEEAVAVSAKPEEAVAAAELEAAVAEPEPEEAVAANAEPAESVAANAGDLIDIEALRAQLAAARIEVEGLTNKNQSLQEANQRLAYQLEVAVNTAFRQQTHHERAIHDSQEEVQDLLQAKYQLELLLEQHGIYTTASGTLPDPEERYDFF